MNDIKSKMMSKIGYITIKLAREFLKNKKDDRIKTIKEFVEDFNTGRGTIQSALNFLQEHQAIELESRGHLGTFIVNLDYKLLWEIADIGIIMGVMPLPYSLKYEGLATGLNKAFSKADIPFSIAFMRGAKNRLKVLEEGKYDFVVLSKFAAENFISNHDDFEVMCNLGVSSYLSRHVVIFADEKEKQIKSGMTIGIDSNSIDHKMLTELECKGIDVEFVDFTYMQIIKKIKDKSIDAAIWNYDEIEDHESEINFHPLKQKEAIEKNEEISSAILLVRKADDLVKNIFSQFISIEGILQVQQDVCNNKIIPEY